MELTAAAADAAPRFAIEGAVHDIRTHPGGHIHSSFLVTAGGRRYLLQRLNTRVFPRPELVMENIAAATAHLASRGQRTLAIVLAHDRAPLVTDALGDRWRMFDFIEGAVTHERARDATEAESAARAFADFQRALADYAGPALHVTIPHFHDTSRRVDAFESAWSLDLHGRKASATSLVPALDRHRGRLTHFFETVPASDPATVRIAHHDAKIANVLFDGRTGEALCVVDLDTLMPGLSMYDFGDLVRSMVSAAAEDEPDASRVVMEPERYAAIVRGYVGGMGALLTKTERQLLPVAAEAMLFEQAVRFLTDHLDGDIYYHIDRPGHNLDRARAQFALLDSISERTEEFRRMVADA